MVSDESRIVVRLRPAISPEDSRDARARAWAYVFSCWRAKREDGSAITPRRPEDERDEEVSHVDHSSVEASNIIHPQFTEEKE